ncbi:MAG: carbohydrate ABC transporter permease [Eubacteriales bacterium]
MKIKKKERVTIFDIFLYILFGVLAVLTIYPFYNVVIISFSNTIASATYSPYLLPYVIDLTAYKTILMDSAFVSALTTTLFVTIVGTTLNMTFSVVAAYVLSKKELLGRNFMLTAILFTMLFSGGMIPSYLVIKDLGLVNNIWVMILPSLINTYYLIIMKNYFASLPVSLAEAARIDGANEFVILIKIYLPVSAPFMATFSLFYMVERWNEWWLAFIYINDQAIKPLQIYLREILVSFNSQLSTQAQSMLMGQKVFVQSIQMAAIIVTMLPIVCVYPFVQKYFVKGIMIGSIKE